MIERYNEYVKKDNSEYNNHLKRLRVEEFTLSDEIKKLSELISNLEKEISNTKGIFKKNKKSKLEKNVISLKEKLNALEKQLKQNKQEQGLVEFRKKEFGLNEFISGNATSQSQFVDIYSTVRKKDGEVILTPDDINLISMRYFEELDHNYTSLNEFCWVHKTNYLPQNSVIKTTNNSTLKKDSVLINGESYEYEYSDISRNTVHGAINSEVSSHEYGSWDNCKYAIIIPFIDMPLNDLKNFNVVDTYFEGDIKIPSSAIILCPKEEMKKVKENNPNVNIVGYTGKSNVTDFANRIVYLLGYRYETVEKHGWQNLTNQKRAESVALNNGFSTGKHSGTNENIKERALKGLKKFVKILEIIENNNLVNNDNLYDIFNQLKKQNVLKSEDSFNEIKHLEKLGYIDSNLAIKLNQAVMENDGNLDDVLIIESLKTLANKSNNLNNTTKKSL